MANEIDVLIIGAGPAGSVAASMIHQAGHIEAAALRNVCRRAGIQVGTIDAILAQLCIRHDLTMLTTDNDFSGIAGHTPLRIWKPTR